MACSTKHDFGVAYNDCDYGFKLTQRGLKNVYCADAILYHHEGFSRGVGRGNDKPSEEAAFVRKYAGWEDPFYNPNLALGQTDFAIKPVSAVTTPVPKLRVALITHNLNYEGAPTSTPRHWCWPASGVGGGRACGEPGNRRAKGSL